MPCEFETLKAAELGEWSCLEHTLALMLRSKEEEQEQRQQEEAHSLLRHSQTTGPMVMVGSKTFELMNDLMND